MMQPLNVLNIEDNPADFLLIERHLRQQGMDVACVRVDTAEALQCALDDGVWDLVLSDFSVPRLDFYDSFARIQSCKPHLPVILISGSVGEEQAVELLKLGVWDFVLKDNLTRLVPVINRALKESGERQARFAVEEALRESEHRFRSIFDNSPIAIGIGRKDDGRLVEVNDAWLRLYGFERDEVIGKSIVDLNIYVNDEERNEIIRTINERGHIVNREVHQRRKSGETIIVQYTAELITLGKETFLQAMLSDITERRNLEEQLRQSQKMEAVGQLAGGVAHDYNNILQVIMGNTQLHSMYNQECGGDAHYLEEISKAVERGASLTRSLLVFCRKQRLDLTVFDLNGLVNESHKLALRLVTEEITIGLELGDHVLNIRGDSTLMQNVIFNLVTNARDAISRQGKIAISTRKIAVTRESVATHGAVVPEGFYALLRVKDSGCGIGDEIRDKIFEPFFTTKEVGKGTGLGLAMIYGTIRQMGGFIVVNSQPGAGTVIEIYVPLVDESAVAPVVLDMSTRIVGKGELLLIVDDEEGVRNSLAQILTICDYRAMCASSGEEAIALVREHASELKLVIMDIVLPGMNGLETARELNYIIPDVPVIFFSGYGEESLGLTGFSGCRLRKPVHPVELLKHINQLLRESCPEKMNDA